MYEEFLRELCVHGKRWEKIHGGYFADPAVAASLVHKIGEAMEISRPKVVVDLGGGTGFLLTELLKKYPAADIRTVDVDVSETQLCSLCDPRISRVHCSIERVKRGDLDGERKRFLFVMRSALHYAGKDGLSPLLRHLRSQMREGEFFVHQTACFESKEEACCLNRIYEEMKTCKWYPTIAELSSLLEDRGWRITDVSLAPALALTSNDLSLRYGLSKEDIELIGRGISETYGDSEVFSARPDGFCAYLHYRIFTCIAC